MFSTTVSHLLLLSAAIGGLPEASGINVTLGVDASNGGPTATLVVPNQACAAEFTVTVTDQAGASAIDTIHVQMLEYAQPTTSSPPLWGWLVGVAVLVVLLVICLGRVVYQSVQRGVAAKERETEEREKRANAAIECVSTVGFPVSVMSFAHFRAAGALVTHEAARDAGHLKFLDTWDKALSFSEPDHGHRCNEHILFVSHQVRRLPPRPPP